MPQKISSKVTRELVAYAESKGFVWGGKFSGKGHIIMRHPNGQRLTISNTPRSTAALNYVRQQIDKGSKP